MAERGEKRRLQELADAERAGGARLGRGGGGADAPASGGGARGAPRGAEPRGAAVADRVLRHLEHPGVLGGRLDGRLPGRGRRRRRTTASSGSRAGARTTSRRSRRSSRGDSPGMRDVADEEYDESFSATPNLVVVDGGKGQLSAVLAAMQAFDLPRVAVISLAKREEEVFVPDRPEPIVLDRHSAGLQLLQRIRDEAHRFALGFHRQRRDSKAKESIFDTLAGRRPGTSPRPAPALRLRGAVPRREPGRARGRARGCRRRRRARSTPSSTKRAAPDRGQTP